MSRAHSPDGQFRLVAFSSDIGHALTAHGTVDGMLRASAEAIVKHLDAAFARIWVLSDAENVLILRASAGQYTHLDGQHGRVPVGQFKIGQIAQERKPHLTNSVIGDPRVSDQEWAVREGMVAFAGYPLIVEDRLVGVMALFARHPLLETTLLALESVADQIALGINHKHTETALRDANRRATNILESITDAFFALDQEWRFTYLNEQAEVLLRRSRPELIGRSIWDEFPEAVGTTFEQNYQRAATEQVAASFQEFYPPLNTWFEVRAYPSPDGLSVYFHDINDRKKAEDALRESETRFRALADNIAQLAWMAGSDGALFWYNQRWFDYTGTTLAEMMGWGWQKVHDPEFLEPVTEKFRSHVASGQPWEDTFPLRGADGKFRWFLSRAFPTYDADGNVALWCGTNTDITDQREAETKLTTAYAREALLNRLGVAIRASTDPERIRETAAALMGEALAVDRCYFSVYDPRSNAVRITRDWHRPDLPSVAGEYQLAQYQDYVTALYSDGTAVINDALAPDVSPDVKQVLAGFDIRAFLAVPLFDNGRFVAALAASVSNAARVWTPDEIALMEAVLTQTRTAMESARVQAKEHRIAEQLQEALQPAVPENIPGLEVGKFTRPALDEAAVGGDFFDVFPLDKDLYALVIGDVSGKGLAAAQQLALIRNSLRTTLYLYRAPAEAAARLNSIVTAYDLLVGFVTAWVGIYDAATGQVAYCSCGHEPGLVRRTNTIEIEAMETTGPPLGVAQNAQYDQKQVTLNSGDSLLLYTDGISESGPNRREMLGTDGLMPLLRDLPAGLPVQAQAETFVAQVKAYANDIFRDDVAVLLVRRQ